MGYSLEFTKTQALLSSYEGARASVLESDMSALAERLHKTMSEAECGRFQTSTLLLPAIRYVNDVDIVMEKPPSQMTISVTPTIKDRLYEAEPLFFTLNIPWSVYTIYIDRLSEEISQMSVFFRSAPLKGMEDVVSPAIIPNLFERGVLCMSDDRQKYVPKLDGSMSLATLTQAAYNMVWSSGFNMDLVGMFTEQDTEEIFGVDKTHYAKANQSLRGAKINLAGWGISMSDVKKIIATLFAWEEMSMAQVLNIDWKYWISSKPLSNYLHLNNHTNTKSFITNIWSQTAATKTRTI